MGVYMRTVAVESSSRNKCYKTST